MMTPLLLSVTVELWDESAMMDFNPVNSGIQSVANATKIHSHRARSCVLHNH